MAIKRGTTPTHTFTLPFDVTAVKAAKIIYAQDGEVILCKSGDEIVKEKDTLSVTLTQEDTFKLDCSNSVEIQVRILTEDGNALSSEIIRVWAGCCLENEVIS